MWWDCLMIPVTGTVFCAYLKDTRREYGRDQLLTKGGLNIQYCSYLEKHCLIESGKVLQVVSFSPMQMNTQRHCLFGKIDTIFITICRKIPEKSKKKLNWFCLVVMTAILARNLIQTLNLGMYPRTHLFITSNTWNKLKNRN